MPVKPLKASLMDGNYGINCGLKEFIAEIANSSIKLEILDFIYSNPSTFFDSFHIAQSLGRDEIRVKEVLEDFVENGLLTKALEEPVTLYAHTFNNRYEKIINTFMKVYNSPSGRRLAISLLNGANQDHNYKTCIH